MAEEQEKPDTTCDWCEEDKGKIVWRNLMRQFCSIECTNKYLDSEGFEQISDPSQSAAVKAEYRDL